MRDAASAPVMPGAGSTGIAALFDGPPRPGRVLGVFPSAVYVVCQAQEQMGTGVVAVVTVDGVRLPNAMVVAAPAAARPFAGVRAGHEAWVGGGAVVAGPLPVAARRWWDPRPRLRPADAAVVRRRVARLAASAAGSRDSGALPDAAIAPLRAALARLDAGAVVEAAGRLVGFGPGLTPGGDDVLAGALAGLRLVGEAVARGTGARPAGLVGEAVAPPRARRPTAQLADDLAVAVDALAGEGRTTALSAALLVHAGRGEVATPAADVLVALTGGGDLDRAVAALVRVGHTSGVELARGIALGAAAACAAAAGNGGAHAATAGAPPASTASAAHAATASGPPAPPTARRRAA